MHVIVFWVIIDSLIYSSTLDIFTSQECEWLKKVRHVLSSICKLNPLFLITHYFLSELFISLTPQEPHRLKEVWPV